MELCEQRLGSRPAQGRKESADANRMLPRGSRPSRKPLGSLFPGGGGVNRCPRYSQAALKACSPARGIPQASWDSKSALSGTGPPRSWGSTQAASFTHRQRASAHLPCVPSTGPGRGGTEQHPLPEHTSHSAAARPPTPAEWEAVGLHPGDLLRCGNGAGFAPVLAHSDPGLSSSRLPLLEPRPSGRNTPTHAAERVVPGMSLNPASL